jgi:hypothetical protein
MSGGSETPIAHRNPNHFSNCRKAVDPLRFAGAGLFALQASSLIHRTCAASVDLAYDFAFQVSPRPKDRLCEDPMEARRTELLPFRFRVHQHLGEI